MAHVNRTFEEISSLRLVTTEDWRLDDPYHRLNAALRELPTTPLQVFLYMIGACADARLWVGDLTAWKAWTKVDPGLSSYKRLGWLQFAVESLWPLQVKDQVPMPDGCICLSDIVRRRVEEVFPYLCDVIEHQMEILIEGEVSGGLLAQASHYWVRDVLAALRTEMLEAVTSHFRLQCSRCGNSWDRREVPYTTCLHCGSLALEKK